MNFPQPQNEKISVIIPVYNAEQYLNRCVDSILGQSYGNFELILVDDGSKDDSLRICNEYGEKDERVNVLHISNSGSAVARNRGMDIMTGEYLIFVDSDDWIEQDAFINALNAIRDTDNDIVNFSVYSGEKPDMSIEPISVFDKEEALKCILSGETSFYSNRGYYLDGLWAKIYRTDYIEKNHIRFPDKLIRSQDSVFCLYALELAAKVSFSTYRYYHYEKNGDSICNTFSNKAVRIIPELLRENDAFIDKYYPDDRSFYEANNRGIFPKLIEADRNYFFHKNNKKTKSEIYQEYRALLTDPTVSKHIRSIDASGLSRNQKIKLMLYLHPNAIGFSFYSLLVRR